MTEIRIVTPHDIDLGLNKLMREWLTETAFDIEAAAKRNCPVDTGRLRSSITTVVGGKDATIGTDVEYALPVHEGTPAHVTRSRRRTGIVGKIIAARAGQPFLARAFDEVIDREGNPIRL